MVCAHWLKRLLETSILGWKQKQDQHRASKDFHHPRGTLPKFLLPGFISQSGKHCCSSWVGAASTPRNEQKRQWSLLWYFPVPSEVFGQTFSPPIPDWGHVDWGIKRVLFTRAGEHGFSWGSPGQGSSFPAAVGHPWTGSTLCRQLSCLNWYLKIQRWSEAAWPASLPQQGNKRSV